MSKLTPWFDGGVAPVRPGVYERRLYSPNGSYRAFKYAYWTGHHWCSARATEYEALKAGESGVFDAPWRGLASKAQEQGA